MKESINNIKLPEELYFVSFFLNTYDVMKSIGDLVSFIFDEKKKKIVCDFS